MNLERVNVLGEIVTIRNSRGIYLDGILYRNPANQVTVIHVHGSFGNFYQNFFLRLMAKKYLEAGFNFFSFNLSAHDGIAEAYRYTGDGEKDDFEYIGFSVVDFRTCLDDIEGAIEFVKPFSKKIILQGHSFGCDRIVYYMLEKKTEYNCILLGPADSYNLQKKFRYPETVEEQIERLKKRPDTPNEYDWLSLKEYGVAQPPYEVYTIPMTKNSLLSIMEGPPYVLFNIEFPMNYKINANALVYLAGEDGYLTWPSQQMFNYLEEKFHELTRLYYPYSDHYLKNVEEDVIDKIINWLDKNK